MCRIYTVEHTVYSTHTHCGVCSRSEFVFLYNQVQSTLILKKWWWRLTVVVQPVEPVCEYTCTVCVCVHLEYYSHLPYTLLMPIVQCIGRCVCVFKKLILNSVWLKSRFNKCNRIPFIVLQAHTHLPIWKFHSKKKISISNFLLLISSNLELLNTHREKVQLF